MERLIIKIYEIVINNKFVQANTNDKEGYILYYS